MPLSPSLDYSPISLFILLFFSSKSLASDPRQPGTRRFCRYFSLAWLVVASFTVTPASARDTTAHWDLGIGIGGLSIPHYRGSDQRQDYVAPIPYVRYEGKRLKIDREGGRFYLYKGDNVQLDLSTSIAFPVDSHDDRARQGMPDLHPVFELGPRAQYVLYTNPAGNLQWRLALPVRLAIATNIRHTRSIGLVFSPYLQLRYLRQWDTAMSAGPIFASETYHDYYYQVDPQYATATRPAYDAKGGYSGIRLTLSASRRFRHRYWLGLFLRYDRFDGAIFADSPLVKQNHSFMAGLAFAWILSQGERR
ncbi:MAG: MipA/OmpV family protein [Gammaproteobacteria bacterium]